MIEDGIHVDNAKIFVIRDEPSPSNKKKLGSFISLASYYRLFIKRFAKVASPLTDRASKNISFEWTENMQNAFEASKEALKKAPLLAYPDHEKPFIVATDASSKEIVAVLSQLDGTAMSILSITQAVI